MNIRPLTIDDMTILNDLHDKYFSEFERTDFLKGMLNAFVITDNYDRIVMGGGIRPIAETIIVTDKEVNPHVLGDALLEALKFSKFTCNKFNIELLHAFVKDKVYMRHLIKQGFSPRCQALYMDVTNG
jgi:hypothetical protein